MVGERRFQIPRHLKLYAGFCILSEEILDRKAQIEETMFWGLRCTLGVSDQTLLKSLERV